MLAGFKKTSAKGAVYLKFSVFFQSTLCRRGYIKIAYIDEKCRGYFPYRRYLY